MNNNAQKEPSIIFFGTYLLKKGFINSAQLGQALNVMAEVNIRIGELAVSKGYLEVSTAEVVNQMQRKLDVPWGELAMSLGHITEEQLQALLIEQKKLNIHIGDACIRLGFITESQRNDLLQCYLNEQETIQASNQLSSSFYGADIINYLIDYLPRLALRIIGRPVKVGIRQEWIRQKEFKEFEVQATVSFRKVIRLDIAIVATSSFGKSLAMGLMALEEDEVETELLGDSMGEFLNMLVGNTLTYFDLKESFTPNFKYLPEAGMSFELEIGVGEGRLIINNAITD